jgi:hypothetical protein
MQSEQSGSAVRALQNVCNALTAVMGRRGADALLARALYLASQSDIAIGGLVPEGRRDCESISEALHATSGAKADSMAIALGGQLLAVVAQIIGEELTRNLLVRIPATGPTDPTENFGR